MAASACFDDVLDEVGEFGRWQIWLFALLWVPSAASAMQVFMYAFIAYTPERRCRVPQCGDGGDFGAEHAAFTSADDGCQLFK